MLRFLMAGLVTVAGVVLLLMASMNDPGHALSEVRAWLPIPAQPAPSVTPPSVQRAATPPANPPVPVVAPEPQAIQQQPGKLQQQLQTLQSQYAQATQETASLRGATDTDKQEITRLQQQLAADQAALQREKVASPSTTQSTALQAMQQQHEKLQQQLRALQSQYAQATQETTSLRGSADSDKQEIARLRQQHAADQAELERERAATPHTPVASAMAPPAPDSKAPPAGPPRPSPPKTSRAEYDSADAIVDRLRHEQPPPAPAASQAIPSNPQAASAHQRLFDARAALSAGHIDDARGLLEQAQVQLVFRPTDPSGAIAANGSVAAGQVAEALSMLGAGDIRDAMEYIELAMRQAGMNQSEATRPIMAAQSPYDLASPR